VNLSLEKGNSLAVCRGPANAVSFLSYGLKGQNNLAQGNALGKHDLKSQP
jgi:hypothetical protein